MNTQSTDDAGLLAAFVAEGSDAAFSELVRRHLPLVLGVARRIVEEPELAADVGQAVFILFARKARSLGPTVVLAGWMHETARHVALRARRSDARRRNREREALAMIPDSPTPEPPLGPELDEALARLDPADRDVLLLRFVHGCSHREIAGRLGVNEETARKRGNRALERLRRLVPAAIAGGTTAGLAAALGGLALPLPAEAAVLSVVAAVRSGSGSAAARELAATTQRAGRIVAAAKTAVAIAVASLVVFAALAVARHPRPRAVDRVEATSAAAGTVARPDSPRGTSDAARRDVFLLEVTTTNGTPLAGANVPASFVVDGAWTRRDDLYTDAAGRCAVPLPSGHVARLDVGANLPGYEHRFLTWRDDWGTERPAGNTLRLAPAETMGGMVVDDGGRPVRDARIRIQWHGTSDASFREPQPERRGFVLDVVVATTDSAGRWTMAVVPAGESDFTVTADHSDSVLPHAGVRIPAEAARFREALIAGTARIQLARGHLLHGRVVDETGRPVAGAEVRRFWPDEPVVSDAAGRFALGRVVTGTTAFNVTTDGYATASIDAPSGPNVPEAIVRLVRGATVRLRVVDEFDAPVAGARVEIGGQRYGMGARAWEGRTDAEGRAVCRSATPGGIQSVVVVAEGFLLGGELRMAADGTERTVRLHRQVVAVGRVVDGVARLPVAEFKAFPGSADRADVERDEMRIGRDGFYSLPFREAGELVVRIEAEGYEIATGRPAKESDGTLRCDFELKPSAATAQVAGVVLDPMGRPAAGVEVGLVSAENAVLVAEGKLGRNEPTFTTRTDGRGEFRFPKVRLPHAVVAASASGYGRTKLDERRPVMVRLEPWGAIEGTLKLADGPVADRGVTLEFGFTTWRGGFVRLDANAYRTRTDTDGAFRFPAVPAGDFRLSLHDDVGLQAGVEAPVAVTPGRTTTAMLAAMDTDGVRVELKGRFMEPEPGFVTDWSRQLYSAVLTRTTHLPEPALDGADASLRAWMDLGETPAARELARTRARWPVRVDERGGFHVEGVPPGQYHLGASLRRLSAAGSWDRDAMILHGVVVPADSASGTVIDLGDVVAMKR